MLDREAFLKRLESGENFEDCRLADLDLSGGLNLESRKFRGADVRGLRLYDETQEKRTNIRGTDWTDSRVGSFGPETIFAYADAEGATFGFTETLMARRLRHQAEAKAGKKIPPEDGGAYCNFNGQWALMKRTKWNHVDFGGSSGDREARLQGADLEQAVFSGCDAGSMDFQDTILRETVFSGCSLAGADLSRAGDITGLVIEDPESLTGLIINRDQVDALVAAIHYSDPAEQDRVQEALKAEGVPEVLKGFGIVVEAAIGQ